MTPDLPRQFAAKYESLAGVACHAADLGAAALAVARILHECNATSVALAGLPAPVQEALCGAIDVEPILPPYDAAGLPDRLDEVDVGVTAAAFAIADAGALVEVAANDAVRLVSTLPRTHVCLVPAARIVATLEEAAPRIEAIFKDCPGHCALTLISGPSRTADIEMQLTLGVHGPEHAYVVIVEEDWDA